MGQFSEYQQYREGLDATQEIVQFEQELLDVLEWKKGHPGKDIPKKEKTEVVKRARRGENVFGGGFDKVEKSAAKRYGSDAAGKRVAAAVMWKKVKGKHMTKEDADDLIWIIEDDLDVILDHAIPDREMLLEKWKKDVEVHDTGENADKSVGQLKHEVESAKGKKGNKEKMGKLLFALRAKQHWKKGEGATGLPKEESNDAGDDTLMERKKKWLKGAIDPDHEGWCTPMSKPTCTGHRRALAKRFKHGDIHDDNTD